MDNILERVIELEKNITDIDSDGFIVEIKLVSDLIPAITKIYEDGLIQDIKIDYTIISTSDLQKNINKTIKIDFIISERKSN